MGDVEVLRRFNRTWTQRIGVLDDSFLGLGLPLGAARLVFEIGAAGSGVGELRARLDLDSGYLSRLLRSLEARGLVRVAADPTDRRRRQVTLTDEGRRLRERLDSRSQELAVGLLAPLTTRQRGRLSAALATADLLVRAATVAIEPADPTGPEARDALQRYYDELDQRFPAGFDPGDAAPPELVVLARSEGRVVAVGGLQALGPGIDEIKRMWVDGAWRGAGVGARLLRHLEGLASSRDSALVRLDTNGALTDAIAMYERAGYRRIARYNDNPYAEVFFEKRLATPEAPPPTPA